MFWVLDMSWILSCTPSCFDSANKKIVAGRGTKFYRQSSNVNRMTFFLLKKQW